MTKEAIAERRDQMSETGVTRSETADAGGSRRGRPRAAGGERVRYFLPKSGSSPDKPELGQEVASEGEALVEAFKSGQLFYCVIAWKAVPKMEGNEAKIVKQSVSRG
jgi:hypothetical protein